jgi:hypothetical protein
MLYTAKGTAALLVPFANVLKSATEIGTQYSYVAAILNIVAALMALFRSKADTTADGARLVLRFRGSNHIDASINLVLEERALARLEGRLYQRDRVAAAILRDGACASSG